MKKSTLFTLLAITFIVSGIGGGGGCAGGEALDTELGAVVGASPSTDDGSGIFDRDPDDYVDTVDQSEYDGDDSSTDATTISESSDEDDMACDFDEHTIVVEDQTIAEGAEYSIEIRVEGGSGEFAEWNVYGYPVGMRFEQSGSVGIISGVPSSIGEHIIGIRVRDIPCSRVKTASFTMNVLSTPTAEIVPPTKQEFDDCSVEPSSVVKLLELDGEDTIRQVNLRLKRDSDLRIANVMRNSQFKVLSKDERYSVDIWIDDFTRAPSLEEGSKLVTVPNGIGEWSVIFELHDSKCGTSAAYGVGFDVGCKLGRVSDFAFRRRIRYKTSDKDHETYDYGFCANTAIELPFINDDHVGRRSDDIIPVGSASGLPEVLDSLLKVRGLHKLSAEDGNNRIDAEPRDYTFTLKGATNICLEDITGFGFLFYEGGCAGARPTLKIKNFEVKACKNFTDSSGMVHDNFEDLNNGSSCLVAKFNNASGIGWSDVRDGRIKYTHDFFFPDPDSGKVWQNGSFKEFDD